MTQTEVNAAFTDKIRRGVFKPVARHLTDPATAEDRLQIAICLTWLMFSAYALQKGKVLSDGILVHSCRQRAVDLDRDFVPADGGCRNQDVLDPRAFRDGKVEVLRLDGPEPVHLPMSPTSSYLLQELWQAASQSERRSEGYTAPSPMPGARAGAEAPPWPSQLARQLLMALLHSGESLIG